MHALKFALGRVAATTDLIVALREADPQHAPESVVLGYLGRHGVGDWGEVDEWDRKANDLALVNGKRLVSGYTTETGVRLSITTEWDRTLTIASLPGEY